MTNHVRNTSADPPLVNLLVTSSSGGIEAQEARGQRELVTSSVLPAKCSQKDRATLEAAGVVFGAPVEGDPLFVNVTLPAGWQKKATDHSMYVDLVDAAGAVRASIFYKAAFYDRRASLYIPGPA